MKRSNLRIGFIVLFASLLIMCNAYPVMCQDQPVWFEIINQTAVLGEDVEVVYEVVDPALDITENDLVQLRREDNNSIVSESGTGGAPSGVVFLDTSDAPLNEALIVVYVLGGETGAVIATAEEKVLVVEAPPEPRPTVEVPSVEAPTIQAAINLVDDGGTVSIKPGVYEIQEPIMVLGKTIIIQGAGSSRKPKPGKLTQLVAPPPDEVADPEVATGIFNFIGGGGIIKDMDMSGGDAAVVGRNYNGASENLDVEDVEISNTGRGILWKASSDIAIRDVSIYNCLHNGFSASPPLLPTVLTKVEAVDVFIGDVENVAYYFKNCVVKADKGSAWGGKAGGLVAINCDVFLKNIWIFANRRFGIGLFWSYLDIRDSFISSTSAMVDGRWGDGLEAWLSSVFIDDILIEHSERAAVANFGSYVSIGDSKFSCQSMDIQGDALPVHFFGFNLPPEDTMFQFEDRGFVFCGCPEATGACHGQSAGLYPPQSQVPIE